MTTTATLILQQLQDYSDKGQQGNDSLKSSVWQMTKVRRKQVRGMLTMEENVLSAEQIREDIRPRVMVRNERRTNDNKHEEVDEVEEEEPELISEGDKKNNNNKDDDAPSTATPLRFSTTNTQHIIPQWKVVDVVQARDAHKVNLSCNTITNDAVPSSEPDSSSGIRQRKNKTDKAAPPGYSSSSRTTGTVEMIADPVVDSGDDEEERLWHRDPLELFAGVRPSDLKFAQTQAKEALDSYIQAANLAALILGELETVKKGEE